ncbi:hypothetical protein [Pseudomonas vancouverensis]|uniref:Uncharacterized protein n=1 Tax=Pseudomonas vancouverensis TaxID=95300 RepID=A0A1H2M6L6_PSEVA|nr:hypothetical protein [Pseudomonas vancouverensis]KAB0498782.1 hypothetical protein F7R09_05585 [Pseudomonas vancouverensis]TDB57479.1 hypothetical protein EIY72_24755 [Pseudomonas vancouverensis]SDU88126.1 hypothetical protein SAMN05216558_0237 [Pseudomonas vancouverensis]
MANLNTSFSTSQTKGTFTGTVDGKPITATEVFAGHSDGFIYLEFDEVDPITKIVTSIKFLLSDAFYAEKQPITVKMSNKHLYAYFNDQRGLRYPVRDGELHANLSLQNEMYFGHFKDLVFGLYDNPDDTVIVSGKFDLKGHTPVFKEQTWSSFQKNYPRDFKK